MYSFSEWLSFAENISIFIECVLDELYMNNEKL